MTKNTKSYSRKTYAKITLFFVSAALMAAGLTTSFAVFAKIKTASATPVEFTLEGQVFIVTKGQQAIRLALVPIVILDEPAIDRLESARTASMNKRREEIAVELRSLVRARLSLEAELVAKKTELRSVGSKTTECAMRLSPSQANYAAEFANCSQAPEMIAARLRAATLYQEVNSPLAGGAAEINAKIDNLLDRYDADTSINDSFDFLAQAAPATVKSDIDGKFQAKVLPGKRVALLAQSSRTVGGDSNEKYRWFIWLPSAKSGEKISIMLANDNLILANECKECVRFNDPGLIRHPEVALLFEEKRERKRAKLR